MLNWLLGQVIRWSSKGKQGNKLNILTYHRVDEFEDPLNPDILALSKFKSQLEWLKKHFTVLSLPEAVALMDKGALPSGAVCLTIDDGYSDSYYHIYKLLKKEQLVANFFIATEGIETGGLWDEYIRHAISKAPNALSSIVVDHKTYDISTFNKRMQTRDEIIQIIKYMSVSDRKTAIDNLYQQTGAKPPKHCFLSPEQIKEMHNNGMVIGGHTHNHPILEVENQQDCEDQIVRCHQLLSEIIDEQVEYFAYPNGKYNVDFSDRHCQILEKLGLKAALSTDWGTLENLNVDRYKIKRFTPWDDSKWRFCFRLALNYRN